MGGWFVATAIGNKLTQIGELWDDIPTRLLAHAFRSRHRHGGGAIAAPQAAEKAMPGI